MHSTSHKPSARVLFLSYLCALAIGGMAVFLTKSYLLGFSGADEPSHFLNGYFIGSYLTEQFGSNPMAAATEFYLHYPKISIGHWPPAYYGFLGILFTFLPPSYPAIFTVNVIIAALPAFGVAVALSVLGTRSLALLGVLLYSLTPLVLEGYVMFMADQVLAAFLVLATAVWISYSKQESWAKIIAFALLAAGCILIKGNGWLIVSVPVFHIILRSSWVQLRSFKLYVAAALAAAIVVPWYMLTAKIAADGFNYQAGFAYATTALLANVKALGTNVTPLGLALAALTIALEFRNRHASPERWNIVAGVISLILATLTLQSLVPVDIVSRYMAPALPALVVLAMLGVFHIGKWMKTAGWQQTALPLMAALLMSIPGILHMLEREPKSDIGLAEISAHLRNKQAPVVTIIDGSAASEGAFIAQMAIADPKLDRYVVRASKLLADSNFMGSTYTLKFTGKQDVLSELRRLGAQRIVIILQDNKPAFAHSQQIRDALLLENSGYRLAQQIDHRYRVGKTEVYEAIDAVAPNIAAVRNLGLPSKVATLSKPE